jgi:hypothetical protein
MAAVTLFMAVAMCSASAQERRLKVVSPDGRPIAYADVTVRGGESRITDERGELSLGQGKEKTLNVRVRRIGYKEAIEALNLSDTVSTFLIALTPLAQQLGTVTISEGSERVGLKLQGFYDRRMQRQKGLLSATFIGPEELESRHPSQISDMLYGINGVTMRRTAGGDFIAIGSDSHCTMAVLLDGQEVIRGGGGGSEINSVSVVGGVAPPPGQPDTGINRWIQAADVVAIEVYARGGNMPVSLQALDPKCGVIAIWTGSRKP